MVLFAKHYDLTQQVHGLTFLSFEGIFKIYVTIIDIIDSCT